MLIPVFQTRGKLIRQGTLGWRENAFHWTSPPAWRWHVLLVSPPTVQEHTCEVNLKACVCECEWLFVSRWRCDELVTCSWCHPVFTQWQLGETPAERRQTLSSGRAGIEKDGWMDGWMVTKWMIPWLWKIDFRVKHFLQMTILYLTSQTGHLVVLGFFETLMLHLNGGIFETC